MPLFQECCVLLPATNLEDFPSQLPSQEACSLLGAWTVLWHPSLLAEMEQLPAWYRADAPPESLDNRLFVVPTPSAAQLPEGFRERANRNQNCVWLEASSRDDFLEQLPWDRLPSMHAESLKISPREITVNDFFAAAYAALQVQIMTKRLRYTSNLDELHLQTCAVNAAKAFVKGDVNTASDALHDLFDSLAEERDHYFSSDPHLIDLVLTGESTLGRMSDLLGTVQQANVSLDPQASSAEDQEQQITHDGTSVTEEVETQVAGLSDSGTGSASESIGACLPTPINLLVDLDAARALEKLPPDELEKLKCCIQGGEVSWAGGGPGSEVCFDTMTYGDAEAALRKAHHTFTSILGEAPPVYGRFSGSTPADLTATLVELGYQGMMPMDFEGGTGFGDEAKVILQAAGVQLEALTAKPIDASDDSSFLTLGTRLGESIDRGEISTGLFAHWPGESCQSFEDLKRVASWSLCLGKFWKLDQYFTEGEHPYHHGESVMVSPHSSKILSQRVAEGIENPISSLAAEFRSSVLREQTSRFSGMSSLVSGQVQEQNHDGESVQGENSSASIDAREVDLTSNDPTGLDFARDHFTRAIGAEQEAAPQENQQNQAVADCVLVNPVSIGVRCDVALTGKISEPKDSLYAVHDTRGITHATVDVPACGFVRLRGGSKDAKSGTGLIKKMRRGFLGGPKTLAEKDRLQNEFMEVNFSTETGAVMGVYSGSRGNRFSLRLVAVSREDVGNVEMKANRFQVTASSEHHGAIETAGVLQRTSEEGSQKLADFRMEYSLTRGSRFLQVKGELIPDRQMEGDPWGNYLALRMAVASEAAIHRTIVRDKLHRSRSRRLVAPAGVLVDEAERQTLVCGDGYPFHRRVGERFLDTLLQVSGETRSGFRVDYGIDVTAPVASCLTRMFPPNAIHLKGSSGGPAIGWVCHIAPKEVLLSAIDVQMTAEGKLAAIIRVVQTRAQTAKVKLRFCRDVVAVSFLDESLEKLMVMDVESLNSRSESRASEIHFDGDQVQFGIHSHGVLDLLVVFD